MTARRAALALSFCFGLVACGARQPEAATAPEVEAAAINEDAVNGATSTGDSDAAVEAAVAFVSSGQQMLDTPATELGPLVESMWSNESADSALEATLDQLAALRERLGAGSGPTRFRQAVLAVRVDSASAARVVVSVWWVGVLSRAESVTPQAQWSTSTVTMVTENGEWKVDAETTDPGPLPDHSSDGEPITHAELERRLTGFVDWGGR